MKFDLHGGSKGGEHNGIISLRYLIFVCSIKQIVLGDDCFVQPSYKIGGQTVSLVIVTS